MNLLYTLLSTSYYDSLNSSNIATPPEITAPPFRLPSILPAKRLYTVVSDWITVTGVTVKDKVPSTPKSSVTSSPPGNPALGIGG